MADIVKHKDVVGISNNPAYPISSEPWNKEHAFAGGSNGNLLRRNTGETDGASWTDSPEVGAVVFALTTPGSPSNGMVWFTVAGTSPARTLTMHFRDGSTTRSTDLMTF